MSRPEPSPELDAALQHLEVQALNFGSRFIRDANVRQDYIAKTQAMSRELRAAHASGGLSAKEAAEIANQMRNEIMEMARVRSSDLGRARAQQLKAKGLDMAELTRRYAQKMFKSDFASLTSTQQERVYLEIVDSAGRANPRVSGSAARLGALGRGLWVLTAVVAIYNVGTAEHTLHAAGREAANLGGGLAGGAAAGALAGIWFGPVGVAVGVAIGGALGAIVADQAYVELTGPREAEVRAFLPRFTGMMSVDEQGIADALVTEYGINMDKVYPVFKELAYSYSTDSDDVARLYLARVRRQGGSLEHALKVHPFLRHLLHDILDGGWTSGEEYQLMSYVKSL